MLLHMQENKNSSQHRITSQTIFFKLASCICSQQSSFFCVVMHWSMLEQVKFLFCTLLLISLKLKIRILWGFLSSLYFIIRESELI